MILFLNLSSYWILSIGYQVLKSTVKTTIVTTTNKTQITKHSTAEGGFLCNIFHQLQRLEFLIVLSKRPSESPFQTRVRRSREIGKSGFYNKAYAA